MSETRSMTGWLLLGLLTVVAAEAAALGVVQSPKNVPLYSCAKGQYGLKCSGAVTNTLTARNYTEVVEKTPNGNQTENLVYQAPDRLGGYIQSGNKRTYVVVIGSVLYQSLTVSTTAPTTHLTFYKQSLAPGQGATSLDRVHTYLPYVWQSTNVTSSGSVYTFTLTKSGQTGSFKYTVSGQYVSQFILTVANASVQLDISQVGSSPPVALPAGARVAGTAPSSAG
jgi:hypothetical protein